MSLVIILDGLVHQESTENPIRCPLSYPTAAEKIIRITGKGCRCREHMQPFLQKTKRRKTEKKKLIGAHSACAFGKPKTEKTRGRPGAKPKDGQGITAVG